MALSALDLENTAEIVEQVTEALPSKTYRINFETGELSSMIDDDEAILQFIHKAIITARSRFFIYDDDYGSELDDLVSEGVSTELLEEEIPRLIKEAIEYDDRIDIAETFTVEVNGPRIDVSFIVRLINGKVLEGVNFNV